ncbi:MAG: helix-turn-helix domain-containing protein [Candidatus Jordarchaeaceae archaeon]
MSSPTDESKKVLCQSIAGEIALSDDPGKVMRKWREKFQISQKDLAEYLGVSPSVISDYESGRRTSPRIDTMRKFVEALVYIDEIKGGHIVNGLTRLLTSEIPSDVILDIREFPYAVKSEALCEHLECEVLANSEMLGHPIYGYTAIDVINAILKLSSDQLLKLYGATPQRAAIFTNVVSGRASMVAIKTSQMGTTRSLKPSILIIHGPKRATQVDPLAIKIAEAERIPLAITKIENVELLIKALRSFMSKEITTFALSNDPHLKNLSFSLKEAYTHKKYS